MTKRELTAALVSPLVIVPMVAVYGIVLLRPPSFMSGMSRVDLVLMTVVIATVSAYLAAFVIGMPAHRLLLWRGYRSICAYLAAWFVAALVAWAGVMIAVFSRSYLVETMVDRPLVPLTFGISWALVGLVFWLVVRPDRIR